MADGTTASGFGVVATASAEDAAGSTPALLAIESDFAGASTNGQIAQGAVAAVQGLVQQLAGLAGTLAPPIIQPIFPQNTNAPAIAAPAAPTATPIVYTPPPIPTAFTGRLVVDTAFPDFTAEPPQLLFPNAPTAAIGTVPDAPGVDFNFTYPKVDVSLPSAPELLSVNLSRFDGVSFPVIDAQSPVMTLVAPQVYAYIADNAYTDDLLSGLRALILDRLTAGEGIMLPPEQERNLYAREQEREYKAQAAALRDLDKMEAMGFALPPGAWVDARIKIQTETAATLQGASRDIAINQAKLAQDSLQKTLEQANILEAHLIEYANQREGRNFEAVKYATQAGIDVYNAEAKAFELRLETYKAAIALYQAQMEGAKLQVQVYTAEIEAEKLKVDMSTALVQQYKVRVDAALASIQVFQGEIDLLKTRAQIENLKVSTYGEQVKAYVAQANVYQAEVEGYKAAVGAEQTKQAAYATSASAYTSLVEAKSKEIDAVIATFRAQIEAKVQEYTAYKAQVEGAAENVRALAATNTATADIYRATVAGQQTYNEAMIKEWEGQISLAEKVAEIGVQAAQAQGQLYISTRSIAADAAKAAAQVEAQIAASALGTVTYATHRARQDSVTYSNGRNTSNSTTKSTQDSKSNNTNNNTTTSTAQNQSYQQSVSQSTSFVHNIQSVE